MRTPLAILNETRIASPCSVPWSEMTGNEYVRHCARCDKQVYDLSMLTAREAVELLRAREGHICVQLYRRKDGTVLTADCPVGVRQRLWHYPRRALALVASLAALIWFGGCQPSRPASAKPEARSAPTQAEKEKCVPYGGLPLPPPPAP